MAQSTLVMIVFGIGYLALVLLLLVGERTVPARVWRICRVLPRLMIGYPAGLLGLMLVQVVWPQEHGLLVVLQIFAPYLFLPLLLIIPFALMRGTPALRWALVLCCCGFALRFMALPRLAPLAPAPGTAQISVLSWNLGLGTWQAQIDRARPVLVTRPADVVVLEEVYWRWIEADHEIMALYPYHTALHGNSGVALMLLSVYPILEHDVPAGQMTIQANSIHRQIVARLNVAGQPLNLIAAHPPSAVINVGPCLVICYDSTARNRRLEATRARIDALLPGGEPLLVAGDFNTTSREPAYQRLSAGLQEAHQEAGSGAGLTWPLPDSPESSANRIPALLQPLLPLIRIDHQFSNDRLTALQSRVDCTRRGSDHCAVWSQFAITSARQR